MRKLSKSLTGALSEILILSILNHKSSYGYDIIKTLLEITNGKLDRKPASIYPLLSKMENKGWIKSEWDLDNERPRRIYHILKEGMVELENQKEDWNKMVSVIAKLNSN